MKNDRSIIIDEILKLAFNSPFLNINVNDVIEMADKEGLQNTKIHFEKLTEIGYFTNGGTLTNKGVELHLRGGVSGIQKQRDLLEESYDKMKEANEMMRKANELTIKSNQQSRIMIFAAWLAVIISAASLIFQLSFN